MNTPLVMRAGLAAAALALLAPVAAQAQTYTAFSTGTPSGATLADSLSTTNWVAEEFTLSSATTVDSISAYVQSAVDALDLGSTFTIALYANHGGEPALNPFDFSSHGQLDSALVTYANDGWNSTASGLGWNLAAGNYWVALEIEGNPTDASFLTATTGVSTQPLAVATYSGDSYSTVGNTPLANYSFGVNISAASPAPEPQSLAVVLAGLAVLGLIKRRRA